MKEKFIDGPLTIKGPSPGGTPCDDGGDYAILDSEGYIIGEAIHKVSRDENGELVLRPAMENAQAWAAMPDMYKTLKAIRKALAQNRTAGAKKTSLIDIEAWAIAALAKARGEEAADD